MRIATLSGLKRTEDSVMRHPLGEQIDKQGFLGLKVVVYRRGCDPRLTGDLAHRRPVVTLLEEQLESGLENGFARARPLVILPRHLCPRWSILINGRSFVVSSLAPHPGCVN